MGFFDRLFRKKSLSSVNSGGGWTSLFGGGFHANFQNDVQYSKEDLAAHPAVFSCVSLISQDIGKMGIMLKKKQGNILVDVPIPKELNILKKPNHYQNWQQFLEFWMVCRKLRGNVYAFKVRDPWGNVVRLVLLNPDQTKPLVSDDGQVFYQLGLDTLNGTDSVVVPASEIIHDRENCLFHPLVGIPAVTAYGLASGLGLNILKNSKTIFGNLSRPSGILVAPGPISKEKAAQAGESWNANYSGQNIGKTAVLGDDLKYQPISMSASDTQTIEQLKMSNEIICSVLHVPAFKVGYGTIPAGQKVGDLNEIYFSDCLQSPVEAIENLLDDAFDLKDRGLEVFLDVDSLIRMDKETQMNIQERGVKSAIFTPNEARQAFNLAPIVGGDTVYMQQQNYSLEALSKRDQKEDPFAKAEIPKAEPKAQYQGIFKSENSYEKGCFVTHKGSLWHCEKDHSGEFNHENFKLAQKKWGEL
ncbi:phage portal protein [Acinetobacter sp. C_4_1]|uniref:phage portal protein n=1 Tax=unclassified Acinetobacter TaxID=196816 RepID=UPI0021B8024A|nr:MULTISPECIES: phage portal protein [unclassified Acinetobacter]MCT8090713.1 phage portal protein [Acinetobacter sp. F_3_1]MCT8101555.1 phage portal protein [Acinetobacter sp. C_4_1]MCT8135110.1 phage portal protein [Acinetobacter sp. T_3_1]